jgi:hypothetical protein
VETGKRQSDSTSESTAATLFQRDRVREDGGVWFASIQRKDAPDGRNVKRDRLARSSEVWRV